jgi:site-specific DNA recombinase
MIKDPNCKNQNYRCDHFDAAIFSEMRGLSLADALEYRRQASGGPDLAAIKKELAKVDQKISRLLDLYADGRFTVDEINIKVNPLKERRAMLEAQAAEIDGSRRSDAELQQVIGSIGDVLDTGDFHAIRALIDALVQKITIDGDDITIYWNFD